MAGRDENNVTAAPAIAAVGAALTHKLFPAKADHSIATIATANVDLCLIVKHKN
jgi:hypothetical protein